MSASPIGQPVTRIDGKLKVTGGARYALDHPFENVAYGVGVTSTIGSGRIASIDSREVERMRGVLAVLHHGNTEKLFRPANAFEESSRAGEPGRRSKTTMSTTTASSSRSSWLKRSSRRRPPFRMFTSSTKRNSRWCSWTRRQPQLIRPTPNTFAEMRTPLMPSAVKFDATYVNPAETHNRWKCTARSRCGKKTS